MTGPGQVGAQGAPAPRPQEGVGVGGGGGGERAHAQPGPPPARHRGGVEPGQRGGGVYRY